MHVYSFCFLESEGGRCGICHRNAGAFALIDGVNPIGVYVLTLRERVGGEGAETGLGVRASAATIAAGMPLPHLRMGLFIIIAAIQKELGILAVGGVRQAERGDEIFAVVISELDDVSVNTVTSGPVIGRMAGIDGFSRG